MTKIPKHFDKTFNTVVETDFIEKQNCTGQKCKDCLLCYKKDTTSIIVEKVKTYGKKKLQNKLKAKKFETVEIKLENLKKFKESL
jgi:Zn-finger protein